MLIFISNMFRRRLRRWLRKLVPLALVAVLSLTVVFVHALLFLSIAGQKLEIKQTDLWFRLRGAVHVPEALTLVSIDESTYRELSLSTLAPLPRGVVADLLESLAESGASLAIIDIFFRDPGNDPIGNEKLAKALGQIPTFIGAFRFEEATGDAGTSRMIEVGPIKIFAERAEKVALMNIRGLDIVRFFQLPDKESNRYPPLVAAYAARIPEAKIPQRSDLIRFYGPPGTIPRVPAYQVLRSDRKSNESRFRGKTVIIGNALEVKTGFATKDSFETPTSSRLMSGVEVHATVVGNVLNQDWIRRKNVVGELLVLSVALLVTTFVMSWISPFKGFLLMISLVGTWAGCAYVAFLRGIMIPGVVAFVILIPVVFVLITLGKHRALRSHFSTLEEMLGLGAQNNR